MEARSERGSEGDPGAGLQEHPKFITLTHSKTLWGAPPVCAGPRVNHQGHAGNHPKPCLRGALAREATRARSASDSAQCQGETTTERRAGRLGGGAAGAGRPRRPLRGHCLGLQDLTDLREPGAPASAGSLKKSSKSRLPREGDHSGQGPTGELVRRERQSGQRQESPCPLASRVASAPKVLAAEKASPSAPTHTTHKLGRTQAPQLPSA